MRRLTRIVLAVILVTLVGLLALGALPSYLGTGDPYYITATPTNASGDAVNASLLSAQRYPYTTEALRTGQSDPYQKGRFGIKEAFTHSPFDEYDSLQLRASANATVDGAVLVDYKGQRYRVELTHA